MTYSEKKIDPFSKCIVIENIDYDNTHDMSLLVKIITYISNKRSLFFEVDRPNAFLTDKEFMLYKNSFVLNFKYSEYREYPIRNIDFPKIIGYVDVIEKYKSTIVNGWIAFQSLSIYVGSNLNWNKFSADQDPQRKKIPAKDWIDYLGAEVVFSRGADGDYMVIRSSSINDLMLNLEYLSEK